MRAPAPTCVQIGGPVLDQPGADAVLDVVAAAVLDDDRGNAGKVQQPPQHQPGRPGPDNSDLRAHASSPGGRTPGL